MRSDWLLLQMPPQLSKPDDPCLGPQHPCKSSSAYFCNLCRSTLGLQASFVDGESGLRSSCLQTKNFLLQPPTSNCSVSTKASTITSCFESWYENLLENKHQTEFCVFLEFNIQLKRYLSTINQFNLLNILLPPKTHKTFKEFKKLLSSIILKRVAATFINI